MGGGGKGARDARLQTRRGDCNRWIEMVELATFTVRVDTKFSYMYCTCTVVRGMERPDILSLQKELLDGISSTTLQFC